MPYPSTYYNDEPQTEAEARTIIAANLASARKHLRYVLCNQGIDMDEACEEAVTIERRLLDHVGMTDERLTSELLSAAYPYEDM